jgi:hypothetical protein
MTDKELHRLKRQDLLQLLVSQGREAEKMKQQIKELNLLLQQSEDTCERLKNRLDEKDKKIEKLKARLDHKDERIHTLKDLVERRRSYRQIALEESGSIAEAALRLNGIFEAAQKAADQYIYNLQILSGEREAEENHDEEETWLLAQIEEELANGNDDVEQDDEVSDNNDIEQDDEVTDNEEVEQDNEDVEQDDEAVDDDQSKKNDEIESIEDTDEIAPGDDIELKLDDEDETENQDASESEHDE